MTRVGIFYSSISNIHKALHKQQLMDFFRSGVLACGDRVKDFKTRYQQIDQIDAGFILGYTLENNYRKKIIDTLKLQGSKIVFVDSNIFGFARKAHQYHRYSIGSVYPTDGKYFFDDKLDETKLDQILQFHRLDIKPWRQNGDHILLLGQRTLSWNMLNINGLDWITDMVRRIKKHTDRTIVIRLHPGDKTYNAENRKKITDMFGKNNNVMLSTNESIQSDLINAWCSVGYNSTPNCASVIEGIPVYLDDPLNSWAKDVGFNDLSLIESPPMPERINWLHKISNIHYNSQEIQNGSYWRKVKNHYYMK
jgi:hypothetical protein